jgi:DNA polymerase V
LQVRHKNNLILKVGLITMDDSVSGIYAARVATRLARPLLLWRVPAGFPSPAEDYVEGSIDLNRDLVKHPFYTFYVRVDGDSMVPAIQPGALLVVDRMAETREGHIVLARIGPAFLVKRLHFDETGRVSLLSDNEAYAPIEITEEMDFEVWGRVLHSIQAH